MTTKKRRLSDCTDAEGKTKKRKIDTTESKILNIEKFVENNKIIDVVFTVGVDGDIEQFNGVKAFFASQSEVLCNMLYGGMVEGINMLYGGMVEGITKEIVINDIRKEAFAFLRDYCYLKKPELLFSQVIDILYAAQKYMIHNLINECNEKILSISSVGTFYTIMESISKYAPSTFETIVKNIMNCHFVKNNTRNIIKSDKYNVLTLFQCKLLIELITFNEFEKYKFIKKYCEHYINNDIDDKGNMWQSCYTKNFEGKVDFGLLDVRQLMDTVRNDKVISDTKLLDEVDKKIKHMQSSIDQFAVDKLFLKGCVERSENQSVKWKNTAQKHQITSEKYQISSEKYKKESVKYQKLSEEHQQLAQNWKTKYTLKGLYGY